MKRPVVWSIAGTDPSAGAGIPADLKTFQGLGVYGGIAITAVIAQNTQGVQRVDFMPPDLIAEQIRSLADDLPPAAIKIGMLGTGPAISSVCDALGRAKAPVVYDPVMSSGGGQSLFTPSALALLCEDLLPRVRLLTPNIPEAETLLRRRIENTDDMEEAARDLLRFGMRSVLIKGGHLGGAFCQDYWTNGETGWWFTAKRRRSRAKHGTGCTLSSAIAAGLALRLDDLDAVTVGKAYVHQGIRLGEPLGKGAHPLTHAGWPNDARDMPWVTRTAQAGRERPSFPDYDLPRSVYAIASRADAAKRLLDAGAPIVQIRIKDLESAALDAELARTADAARDAHAAFIVNDHWSRAASLGAFGVHVGQDDLDSADLDTISKMGLRLGVSAHGYFEVARALGVNPSYIAIGTVFHSPSKSFDHDPIGLKGLERLAALVDRPVVAIGGITVETAPRVLAAGAHSIAVISDLARAADPEARVRQWRDAFASRPCP